MGGRFEWVMVTTLSPGHVAGDLIAAGVTTAYNSPSEYGTNLDGFGKRFGIDMAGAAVQNTMEAGLGAIWESDPHYFRVPDEAFGTRVKNVVVRTFEARRRNGEFGPSYARFIAIPGANFLSNTWRADSQATATQAIYRTIEAFGVRMGGNAFDEFWPDVKLKVFHKSSDY
jgi:hypothetical protein